MMNGVITQGRREAKAQEGEERKSIDAFEDLKMRRVISDE